MEKGGIKRRWVTRIAIVVLVLGLIGVITGFLVFRNVLSPGQQQRVINILPFMDALLWRPPENYRLPTPFPATNAVSPEDLLNITLEPPTSATSTPTEAATEETTPTLTPTS